MKYLMTCLVALFYSCSTPETIATGIVLTGLAGANTPTSELEQTYYLGTFDPHGQIPPTIYRVRVKGQASVWDGVKFASGWVPAEFVDSLSSNISFTADKSGKLVLESGSTENAELSISRRMIQFGPEGFREVPSKHRLVIVMGSDPSSFFSAVDETLGSLSPAKQNEMKAEFNKALSEAQIQTASNLVKLKVLENKFDKE